MLPDFSIGLCFFSLNKTGHDFSKLDNLVFRLLLKSINIYQCNIKIIINTISIIQFFFTIII